MLGVGDGVADDGLQERLEHRAHVLVDEAGDALDAATAGQAADGGLGDALDVVAEDLAVALRAALAEALAPLTSAGHAWCSWGPRRARGLFIRQGRSSFFARARRAGGPAARALRPPAAKARYRALRPAAAHASEAAD